MPEEIFIVEHTLEGLIEDIQRTVDKVWTSTPPTGLIQGEDCWFIFPSDPSPFSHWINNGWKLHYMAVRVYPRSETGQSKDVPRVASIMDFLANALDNGQIELRFISSPSASQEICRKVRALLHGAASTSRTLQSLPETSGRTSTTSSTNPNSDPERALQVLRRSQEGVRLISAMLDYARQIIEYTKRFDPVTAQGARAVNLMQDASQHLQILVEQWEAYQLANRLEDELWSKKMQELALREADKVEREKANKNLVESLTSQQIEILKLVAKGLTNAAIATRLRKEGTDKPLSAKTVRNYLADAMQKLGAENRTEAAMKAVKLGIIDV